MFSRLGRFAVRRRRLVLVITSVFLVVSAAAGGGVFNALKGGGFEDPHAESTKAELLLEQRFGQGDPNVVILFTPPGGSVDSPAAQAAGRTLTERLAAEPGVTQAASYWSLGNVAPLRSQAGDKALAFAFVEGDEDQVKEVSARIVHTYTAPGVEVGGMGAVYEEMSKTIESDLAKAEAVAVPITLILLVFIFGGLVAASLPLVVGAVAVFGAFLSLFLLAQVTDVSVFSINLCTAMGLGLAIDYSLFVVSRFREELGKGKSVEDAVVKTVETAGRTVAFSGLTVAVSLSALLVFPLYFLRSFAYAGVAVVLVAALASVISLPALLAVLGHRVDKFKVIHRQPSPEGTGFWHRIAMGVMKRPVGIAGAVIAVLLLLGVPFLNVAFGTPDDRSLPEDAHSRQVSDQLRRDFDSNESEAFSVVLDGSATSAQVDRYAASVSALPAVARVDAATGNYIGGQRVAEPNASTVRFVGSTKAGDGTWVSVVPKVESMSLAGEHLVKEVRAIDAGVPTLVGGSAAGLVDSKASIFSRLPLAGLIIVVSTFVLLFLLFGSVVVPLKAIVLNLLSLTATFGAMVWVFQQGHGSGFLNFTATGTLDTTTPILMFCVAFGLSMDYEVFLLSRIKEEHDRTGDNTASVAMGLERTGRIVTAAAALLSVTFLAMATSGITFIKLFGLGLAVAVVMDATIVRATLVPAFMRLAGEANWWAPRPLRRIYDRWGISESEPEPEPEQELVNA
ncbi:MAG: putative rane protein [Acidimicrobiales bacterium]|nr:putative rane protein [Acidimicrobiales bacterium]